MTHIYADGGGDINLSNPRKKAGCPVTAAAVQAKHRVWPVCHRDALLLPTEICGGRGYYGTFQPTSPSF